ncbi:MAG: hypothetical protein WCE69_02365 [Aestuariivirga sp.]
MNKIVISTLTLLFVTGVASTESYAKRHKNLCNANVEVNTPPPLTMDSRKAILELREQHRIDEKADL